MKNTTKRMICAVLSILLLLSLFSSCGKETEYKAELSGIAEANTTKNLLEAYDSVLVTFVDSTGVTHGYYMDQELGHYWGDSYTDAKGNSQKAYSDVTTTKYQAGFEGEAPYSVFYAGGKIDGSWYENVFVKAEVFVLETVEDVTVKNGLVTYRTKLSMLDLVDYGYSASADNIYHYYITEYTVDAETLHFQSIKETYYDKDGNVESSYTCTVQYNVERPELAKSIVEHQEKSETCTISVVKDMDTANESTELFTVPKGDKLYFYWYGDYQSVYTDRECKNDFKDGSLVNEDLTLYLK